MSREEYHAHIADRKRRLVALARDQKLHRLACYVGCLQPNCNKKCLGWRKGQQQRDDENGDTATTIGYQKPCAVCGHSFEDHLPRVYYDLDDGKLDELVLATVDVDFVVACLRTTRDRDGKEAYGHLYRLLTRCLTSAEKPTADLRVMGDVPFEKGPSIRRIVTNFVAHKFGACDRSTWQVMYDIASILLACLNKWEFEPPSASTSFSFDSRASYDCYRRNYKRWIIYCHAPGYCSSLPDFESNSVFGKSTLRAVFGSFKRHFETRFVEMKDKLPADRRELLLRHFDVFLKMLESEIHSECSPIWDEDFKPTVPQHLLPNCQIDLNKTDRNKIALSLYEESSQDRRSMSSSRDEDFARLREQKQRAYEFSRPEKLAKLARYSRCQAPECDTNCIAGVFASNDKDNNRPDKFADECGRCGHALESHVAHLTLLSDDAVDRLLGMAIDADNITVGMELERDPHTRRVYAYLLELLRSKIRRVNVERLQLVGCGSPPFERPTISQALTDFVIDKLGHLEQNDYLTMIELSRMFVDCLNHWNFPPPSLRNFEDDPSEAKTYEVNYCRWLVFCHVPAFCSSLPRTETVQAFGRTFARSVFRMVSRDLQDKVFSDVGKWALERRSQIYHFFPKFLAMLEVEIYSDNSSIWGMKQQQHQKIEDTTKNDAKSEQMKSRKKVAFSDQVKVSRDSNNDI